MEVGIQIEWLGLGGGYYKVGAVGIQSDWRRLLGRRLGNGEGGHSVE